MKDKHTEKKPRCYTEAQINEMERKQAIMAAAKDMTTEEAVAALKSQKILIEANCQHTGKGVADIIKASAKMDTEEAVRYLKHGPEMVAALRKAGSCTLSFDDLIEILTKLDKGGK